MKKFVREIKEHVNLYRDSNSGIAWIADGSTGMNISVHANIDASGSVRGMKANGYWDKKDRTVRTNGYIYNIDRFVCDKNDELEMIVAKECMCAGCKERRIKLEISEKGGENDKSKEIEMNKSSMMEKRIF